MTRLATLALLIAMAGCASARSTAAQAASYTAAQAKAGADPYALACGACHAPDLSGTEDAPPLTGPSFARTWDGRPAADLIQFVRQHMPRTFPGLLNDRTYLALIAYMLARNGVPAGEPLTVETSRTLVLAPPR